MIKYIEGDIPQTIVLPQANYSSISKRFLKDINDMFLWSYLGQKFSEYSIKNYFINEQLRKIYLIHTFMKESRMNEEMYAIDDKHYEQLFYTEQVCKCISSSVSELLYCIYFMKQIKMTNSLPEKVDVTAARQFITTNMELSDLFSEFSGFFDQVDSIRLSLNVNEIRPAYDFMLTEEQPTYFITDKSGNTSVYQLRNLINYYNSFFKLTIHVLRHHSPEAIGIGLERFQ